MEYIYSFDMLDKKISENNTLSDGAKAYICLTWLGLSPKEIGEACYNKAMRTVEWNDMTIFVKEDRIASRLASLEDISLCRSCADEAESAAPHGLLYISGFFNMRYEQKQLGQPEDIVRVKEMARIIGKNMPELNVQYLEYEKARNSLKA